MKKKTEKCVDERCIQQAWDVIERTKKLPSEGIAGYDWPVYTKDKDRIAHNNEQFRGCSINEAIYSLMGKKLTPAKSKKLSDFDDYHEINVGDIIMLRIKDIDKKGVTFDSVYKEDIISNVNLYQYEKLRHFIPKDPIRCKVMSKNHNQVVVDPFVVMFDEWLNQRLDTDRYGNIPAIWQYDVKSDKSVTVKKLNLIRGGYAGIVRIDTISEFVGQDVYADAFIPGSQIVLNIENDFEKWEGKSVKAFVSNYMKRPGAANSMSIVCSAKEVLKFEGQKKMIDLFSDYTENNKKWQSLKSKKFDGIITGVLKSSKKSGVFVEVPEMNITGMIEIPVEELVNYKPQTPIQVRWSHFDEPMKYNKDVDQMQHTDPYVIENGILKEFNIKPIFTIA